MGSKLNPGEFDCMSKALPDEPFFILLARDGAASGLVREWAGHRRGLIEGGVRPSSDEAKVSEALALADQMDAWRSNTGNAARVRAQRDSRKPVDPTRQMVADMFGVDVSRVVEVEGGEAYAIECQIDRGSKTVDFESAFRELKDRVMGGEKPSDLAERMAAKERLSRGANLANDPDTMGKADDKPRSEQARDALNELQEMLMVAAVRAQLNEMKKEIPLMARFLWPECLTGPMALTMAHVGALAVHLCKKTHSSYRKPVLDTLLAARDCILKQPVK